LAAPSVSLRKKKKKELHF